MKSRDEAVSELIDAMTRMNEARAAHDRAKAVVNATMQVFNESTNTVERARMALNSMLEREAGYMPVVVKREPYPSGSGGAGGVSVPDVMLVNK